MFIPSHDCGKSASGIQHITNLGGIVKSMSLSGNALNIGEQLVSSIITMPSITKTAKLPVDMST